MSKYLAKASSRTRPLLTGQGHQQHCKNRHHSPHHPRGPCPASPRPPACPALPRGSCGPGGPGPSAPHSLDTACAGTQGRSPGARSRSSRSQTAANPCQGTSTGHLLLGTGVAAPAPVSVCQTARGLLAFRGKGLASAHGEGSTGTVLVTLPEPRAGVEGHC